MEERRLEAFLTPGRGTWSHSTAAQVLSASMAAPPAASGGFGIVPTCGGLRGCSLSPGPASPAWSHTRHSPSSRCRQRNWAPEVEPEDETSSSRRTLRLAARISLSDGETCVSEHAVLRSQWSVKPPRPPGLRRWSRCPGEMQTLPASGHDGFFSGQHVALLYACFCLKTPYFMCVVYSLTNSAQQHVTHA